MPFYIRKSVSVGPFRFNLSKSGIGVSAGVKGFRVGTGPRGHYIHAGRGGLYYRSSIVRGGAKRLTPPPVPKEPIELKPASYREAAVNMVRVSSADVLQMEDARFADILADLTRKQNSLSLAKVLGGAGGGVTLVSMLAAGVEGFIFGALLAVVGFLVGSWLDGFQRSSVLMYDLEEEARNAFEAMTASFDVLRGCAGKWHIDAGGTVQDIHTWKRNAGASHVLDKRPTVFDYSLPRVIKSNITPPAIKSGKETLYFLPDFLLVVDNNKVGAVAYDNLLIKWEPSNFIEEGTVPRDTEILWHTWKHPNKSGGPDRRFSNNYQIPVCRYESLHLTSSNGLNELLQVSRSGVTEPFARKLRALAAANGSAGVSTTIPAL